MRRPLAAAALLALGLLAAGCGYAVTAAPRLRGGAPAADVRPFENHSSDPSVGADVAAALRAELARRGEAGGAGARAVIDGAVRTEAAAPTLPGGATLRVVLEVRARLLVDGKVEAERTVRREADHLGGADALEGEARRAQALQRLAGEAARELLDAFGE
jgi:hypothetical protein